MNKTIHRAVRRDLARFRDALDAFVDGDAERAAALWLAWENFDDQLTDHHEGEHAIAWPALAAIGVPGSTIDTFDVEHEAMAADLAAAGEAMARLRSSASRATAPGVADRIRATASATAGSLARSGGTRAGLTATRFDHSLMSGSTLNDPTLRIPMTFIRAQSDRVLPNDAGGHRRFFSSSALRVAST